MAVDWRFCLRLEISAVFVCLRAAGLVSSTNGFARLFADVDKIMEPSLSKLQESPPRRNRGHFTSSLFLFSLPRLPSRSQCPVLISSVSISTRQLFICLSQSPPSPSLSLSALTSPLPFRSPRLCRAVDTLFENRD